MSLTVKTPLTIVDPNKPNEISIFRASHSSSKLYKAYPYRYLITLLFSFTNMVSAIMWIGTSTITTNLQDIYSKDIFEVTISTSLIWYFVYPFMNFGANYILDEKGLQMGIFAGGGLTVLGLWVRTLGNANFYCMFAGSFLGALGNPFLMNAPPQLSVIWYPPHERALATTIASVSNSVGMGVGFLGAQIFVSNDASGPSGRDQVYNLMFYTAVFGSVLILPIYFLFKKRPPTPPSRGAEIVKYSYMESLKSLLRNKNYMIFVISTGLVVGSSNIFSTTLEPLAKPFGLTSADCGNLGAITLVCGIIGAILWGMFVDRTQKYKFSIVCCTVLSLVSLAALYFATDYSSFAVIAVATACYGFFIIPTTAFTYEICTEFSFPVGEAAAGGLMMVMTQVVALVGQLSVNPLLNKDKESSTICFGILGLIVLVGLIGFLYLKEDLRRVQVEQEGEPLPVESSRQSQKSNGGKTKSLVHPVDDMKTGLLTCGI